MLHILCFFFLSSRCRLFHNAIFFGSCNIHILNTGCAKILNKIPVPKCCQACFPVSWRKVSSRTYVKKENCIYRLKWEYFFCLLRRALYFPFLTDINKKSGRHLYSQFLSDFVFSVPSTSTLSTFINHLCRMFTNKLSCFHAFYSLPDLLAAPV